VTWRAELAKLIELNFGESEIFSLDRVYEVAEEPLSERYPYNNTVRDTIRRELQGLRDAGHIDFLDRGSYRRTTSTAAPPAGIQLSTPYQPAVANPSEHRKPFDVDPDVVDRGLAAHANIQNALADCASIHGCKTWRPGPWDPNFDLAWSCPDGSVVVAEVKSLTPTNEAGQIRLGLGQILDFAHTVRKTQAEVTAVLAVETAPRGPRWVGLCESVGVTLVWPATFHQLFEPSAPGAPL
jgi:hypothetical protein